MSTTPRAQERRAFRFALLALLAICACGTGESQEAELAGAAKPNVVLISVDTLRADHLPTYGYFRATAPKLDRLADEGIVFGNAFTVMSHTLPAHVSLMTGVHPLRHGVLTNRDRYAGTFPTLAERLADAGYATAGFVTGFPLHSDSGLARGFDLYRDTGRSGDGLVGKIAGSVANQRVEEWLAANRRPFFLFLHYFDVHDPYERPTELELPFEVDTELRAHMKALGIAEVELASTTPTPLRLDDRPLDDLATAVNAYDNQIFHVDWLIDRLRQLLRERGLLDDTLLIVTSDHGEGLGQHGYYSHGLHLYEEQLRIPLVMSFPGSGWKPARIDAAVSLLDVLPTLLELVDLPAEPTLDGRSLLADIREPDAESSAKRWLLAQRRNFSKRALAVRGRFASREGLFALRGDSPLKYLRTSDGSEELYDLRRDPLERENLARVRSEDVSRLRAVLEGRRDQYRAIAGTSEQRTDEDTLKALRSLGYIE